ncbi:hypothetical protein IFM89_032296 [Coptis chinensis]|uniref:RanBP2-type domain-containing protein n=1 Tax=Coptis chinensis TaxID=261450 RepID=A0A835LCE0_9MAGN|nr:hypothetical protein IFM89_032296 [Coptis chinensis]
MSWSCSQCTYLNPPSQTSTCQICLSPSSSSSAEKWSCNACTFTNTGGNSNCEICGTTLPVSLISDCKELDLGSSIGSMLLPFEPSNKRKEGDSESSVGFRLPKIAKKKESLLEDNTQDAGLSTLKILTYNVWFREDLELSKRMKALGDLIEQHSPDVMCFQEVTPNIYHIFQQSSWWKAYHCSVSTAMYNVKPYFCMLLSKVPVKSFSCKPFSNSIMGRELCVTEIEVKAGKSLVVATSHLESPCPAPPKWDQMYSKERVDQAKEALTSLKNSRNVVFGGDMNWDDKLDGKFPLLDGWVDAWAEQRPGEDGYTYDTKANPMLSGNRKLQKRLDRFCCSLQDYKIGGIDMIGTEAIPGLSYCKEKKVKNDVQKLTLPVLPSDHYGLILTIHSS